MGKRGKFIVISGPDGTGKRTQAKLLAERMRRNNLVVNEIDFPQYEINFFGDLIGRYLRGEFGEADKVNPYLSSVLYACDRLESSESIDFLLRNGGNFIADRYVSDNQIHQGGRIANKTKRKEFLDFLEEMEFLVFKVPRPDTVIYLDVPLEISLALLKNKSAKERKKYLSGGKDGYENREHLRIARECAGYLHEKYYAHGRGWVWVDCAPKGALLPEEEISNIIWGEVHPTLIF